MAAADVSAPALVGGLDDGVQRLPVSLPPTLDVATLQSVLSGIVDSSLLVPTASGDGSTVSLLPLEKITSPDAALILSIYTFLAGKLPDLQSSASKLESLQAESQRREIEVESTLNEAERTRAEAEQRAEAAAAEASSANAEKEKQREELERTRTELEVVKSSSESGSSALSQLQDRVVNVEQEKRDLLTLLDREKEESARRAGK
jgi:hypothetical protein